MHHKKRSIKNKKAISPVIATVILVAIAVAIAIAVAFWAAGLAGTFTKFEKLDFTSAYANTISNASGTWWNITCAVTNTGSSDATIVDVYINGRPASAYYNGTYAFAIVQSAGSTGFPPGPISISMPTGSKATVYVTISNSSYGLFISGQTVDLKLHTASGTDYPKSLVLT
jgi:flagellin-like protein